MTKEELRKCLVDRSLAEVGMLSDYLGRAKRKQRRGFVLGLITGVSTCVFVYFGNMLVSHLLK